MTVIVVNYSINFDSEIFHYQDLPSMITLKGTAAVLQHIK